MKVMALKCHILCHLPPGDIVKVKETKRHKKYVEAEIVDFIRKSPNRSAISCKHYQICGGCNLLHIEYQKQLQYKKEMAQFMLKRAGITYQEIELIGSDPDVNYRFKAKVFFEYRNGALICGFNEKNSNDTVKIEECHIVHKKIIDVINKINRAGLNIKKRFIGVFLVNQRNRALALKLFSDKIPQLEEFLKDDIEQIIYKSQKKPYSYKIDDISFFYNIDAFIQSNIQNNENMVRFISDYLQNAKNRENLLDLYCGIGNIGIYLTKIFKETILVEGQAESYKMLVKNLEDNKITNAQCYNDEVLNFLKNDERDYDAIILDPPRTGCEESIIKQIIGKDPKTIVYISCNPANSIQEIKDFMKKGYEIAKIALIDMFPHINHVELITILTK